MPPPVRNLAQWLSAYQVQDRSALLEVTDPLDRDLLEEGLDAPSLSRAKLSLPPQPLAFEIDDILSKQEDRWVIRARLTVSNPLPAAAMRIGSPMPNIPTTRTLRQRFLVVRQPHGWRVRLDLDAVHNRAQFSETLLKLIAEGQLAEATEKLSDPPKLPDNGGKSSGADDRLVRELKSRIESRRPYD